MNIFKINKNGLLLDGERIKDCPRNHAFMSIRELMIFLLQNGFVRVKFNDTVEICKEFVTNIILLIKVILFWGLFPIFLFLSAYIYKRNGIKELKEYFSNKTTSK